ncbi:MAG: hypothetical protein WCI26_04900 [Acidimicrobiales bacterium]
MNRRNVVVVVIVAVATVVGITLFAQGKEVVLPVPHPVTATTQASSPGGTSDSVPTTAVPQPDHVIAPAATLTGCTVSVSDPHPAQGHTEESVTVNSTSRAQVKVSAAYPRTTTVHAGVTDSTGVLVVPLAIRSSPVGVTVVVSAAVTYRGKHVSCQSSFTPVA